VIRLLGFLLWDSAGPSAVMCAIGLAGIFAVLGIMRAVWWWSDRRRRREDAHAEAIRYVQTWWERRTDALVEEIEDYLCDR
jgi:hypothetical protein